MANNGVYQLLFSFEAPDKLKSERTGTLVTQYFEEDELVIGKPYMRDKIIVEDRYIIPLDYVEKTDKFPYLKKESKFDETINRIKTQSVQISEREQQKLNKLGTDVKDVIEGKTKQRLQKETKAYRNGAILGLGIGVITALYLRKSVWVFGLLGVAGGGYIAHQINKARQGNNTVEPFDSNNEKT